MLTVFPVGLDLLNRAESRFAESCEDPEILDGGLEVFSNLKMLVAPTRLKTALMETSRNLIDHQRREKEVQQSLMEVFHVRRMS